MQRLYWQVAGMFFINFTMSYITVALLKQLQNNFVQKQNMHSLLLPPLLVLFYTVINNKIFKVFSKWNFVFLFIGSFLGNLLFLNSGNGGLLIFGYLFLIYLPIKQVCALPFQHIFFTNTATVLILLFLFLLCGQYGLHNYIGLKDEWDLLNLLQLIYLGVFHFIIICVNVNHFSKK